MKGFIEVEFLDKYNATKKNATKKAVVSVSNIKYVEEDASGKAIIVFVCVGTNSKRPKGWTALSQLTVETYSEVLAKIAAAVE